MSALRRFRPEFEAYIAQNPRKLIEVDQCLKTTRPCRNRPKRSTEKDRAVATERRRRGGRRAPPPPPPGVPVTIDGKLVYAEKGELLIEAAERVGSHIPRFCYHERLRPVGMCRMCLVEVDSGRGPMLSPACLVECTPDMKVETRSEKALKAQDGVIEFLLVNHPLDCPVCDKGGECPLQDNTIAFGPGDSRMVEEKRHREKPIPLSDLVLLDRERCILCDRCTRFADEVAGDPLIHFIQRGVETEVNTFPDEPFASYFAATPCSCARSARSPRSPTASRPARGTSTRPSPRAPRARSGAASRVQSSGRERHPLPRHRQRPGQPRLAVRQGPLRL